MNKTNGAPASPIGGQEYQEVQAEEEVWDAAVGPNRPVSGGTGNDPPVAPPQGNNGGSSSGS